MVVWVDLVGIPALAALSLVVFGGALIVKPRPLLETLGDAFGFAPRFRRGPDVRTVVARVAGAGAIGYGAFLAINTLALAGAFATH